MGQTISEEVQESRESQTSQEMRTEQTSEETRRCQAELVDQRKFEKIKTIVESLLLHNIYHIDLIPTYLHLTVAIDKSKINERFRDYSKFLNSKWINIWKEDASKIDFSKYNGGKEIKFSTEPGHDCSRG